MFIPGFTCGLAGSFLCSPGKYPDQPLYPSPYRSLAVYLCLCHDDCQVPDHERYGNRDQTRCAADGTDSASKPFQPPKRIPRCFPANPGLSQNGVYAGRHPGDEHLLDDQQHFLVDLRYRNLDIPPNTWLSILLRRSITMLFFFFLVMPRLEAWISKTPC